MTLELELVTKKALGWIFLTLQALKPNGMTGLEQSNLDDRGQQILLSVAKLPIKGFSPWSSHTKLMSAHHCKYELGL